MAAVEREPLQEQAPQFPPERRWTEAEQPLSPWKANWLVGEQRQTDLEEEAARQVATQWSMPGRCWAAGFASCIHRQAAGPPARKAGWT